MSLRPVVLAVLRSSPRLVLRRLAVLAIAAGGILAAGAAEAGQPYSSSPSSYSGRSSGASSSYHSAPKYSPHYATKPSSHCQKPTWQGDYSSSRSYSAPGSKYVPARHGYR